MFQLQKRLFIAATLCMLPFLTASPAKAASLVDVHTPLGTIRIEVFEDQASTAYFQRRVLVGDYDSTFIHYADSSTLAGGSFLYKSCTAGPLEALPYAVSIPVVDSGLAHSQGTVALRRDPNNPNFLTTDWIVNLEDNNSVDPVTGPVVIGEIVEGFEVADAIGDLPTISLDGASTSVPTIQYESGSTFSCDVFSQNNLLLVDMDQISHDNSRPTNYIHSGSNQVRLKIDARDLGLWNVTFSLLSTDPAVIIQAIPESSYTEYEIYGDMTSYDAATEVLTIPELIIYESDVIEGRLVVNTNERFANLVFRLSDPESLQFTLESIGTAE